MCKTTCVRLGCQEAHPLVWTATGKLVGSLSAFETECVDKYDIRIDAQIRADQWAKIAKENLAHAEAAAAAKAATTYPTGEGRGAAVSDALLEGHSRFIAGTPANLQPSETVDATIVLLTPLSSGMSAHALLDTPKQNLFVVECSTPKLDAIAVGNIEHAAMVLGCRSLWLILTESAEMSTALQGVRDQLDGTDKPRAPAVRATVDAIFPAMSRVLAVSDPASSEAELRTLALQEWVRECQDELMHESAVSAQLVASGGLQIVRAVCDASTGKLSIV